MKWKQIKLSKIIYQISKEQKPRKMNYRKIQRDAENPGKAREIITMHDGHGAARTRCITGNVQHSSPELSILLSGMYGSISQTSVPGTKQVSYHIMLISKHQVKPRLSVTYTIHWITKWSNAT